MLQLVTLGVFVNLFLFYSIFDIHFKSPIVPVERRHRLNQNVVRAPFKRVVFYSADGLRAETFLNHPELRPYMRELIESKSCVWGVADTRVPTESRPGHVALFAGFYEDPSAVFTGWKENIAEFDTIFNQTSYSIGLGSPDIVDIFSKGTPKDKMFAATFDRSWQDFSVQTDHAKMDLWVMQYFTSMIKNEMVPERDQLLIFLHLLSIDTTGHAHRPESIQYKDAMKLVDSIADDSQKLVEKYFKDDETLFILTSDHGMTNWGSHGDGSIHETEVPFVIWGKGLKNDREPQRLNQADFAALLAGALGVGYPSNSIGKFPTTFWVDQTFGLEALKANFLQLFDLMMTKKQIVEGSRNFDIVRFSKEEEINMTQLSILNSDSREKKDIAHEINAVNAAMELTLEGIVYYERYDKQLLIVLTVLTTLSWILIVGYVIVRMSSAYDVFKIIKFLRVDFLILAFVSSVLITCGVIGWGLWRIPYGFFPVYLVLILSKLLRDGIASGDRTEKTHSGDVLRNSNIAWINSLFLLLSFSAIGVEILVNSFDKRGVLSLGLILNAIWCTRAKKVSSWQKTLFFVAVGFLAVFPSIPVIGQQRNSFFMTLGPIVSVILVSILLSFRPKESWKNHIIIVFQMILLLAISILIHFPSQTLTNVTAWLSLVLSYIQPIFVSAETVSLRLTSLFLAIACPFSFICFSYEALFFPCIFLVLFFLLKIEMSEENLEDSWTDFLTLSTESRERRKLWEKVDLHQAVRRAWLHLFFVTLSFFGTGNIASINSFDPSSTRCFVTVFNPWIMMLVLIEKILGPFLLVSCFFRRLLWSRFQVERNFLIVLLLCQGMTLHTFFKVKNEGSWLEIGTSISHHVIVSATTLFLFILHFIADFIMSYEPWLSSSKSKLAIPSTHQRQQKHQKLF